MGRTPKTIDEIYNDFQRRRAALVTALTDDAEEFTQICDPSRENLCLYGMADGTWKVDLPAAEVPPELPEPVLGINFARDGMDKKDWLALCAVHSDAWLMSVLFFYGARFDDAGRAELFSLTNQHPTVYEVVTGRVSRDKMYKRKQLMGGRTKGYGAGGGGGGGGQMQAKQERMGTYVAADRPLPTGRLITREDITPALNGRQAELYWPDDGKWYLVQIVVLDLVTRQAAVQYATGEEETLDIDEVVNEGQMSLLA